MLAARTMMLALLLFVVLLALLGRQNILGLNEREMINVQMSEEGSAI